MSKEQTIKKKKNNKISSNTIVFGLIVNFFKPSTYVESIEKINLQTLKENGTKLIICDLDNTLVPHFTKFPTKRVINFVESINDLGMNFVIISNNTKNRVEFFSNKLKINNYIANAKKPFTKNIKNFINENNYKMEEVVIIGDMLITDVLAANFLKIESILVPPLVNNDPSIGGFTKFIEKKLFTRLSRDNIITIKNQNAKVGKLDDYEIL